jgi:Mannosylglycerate hydrolase MGH1-like glycoside hydrolase domain
MVDPCNPENNPERLRLAEDAARQKNWKRFGPYLAERMWGTVREDYSPGGDAWDYFPHDHARSRAYRWGEDGLLGISDRQCRLCFALAMWNGKDPILKERLFGLTGPQGNHGEDVKELYYYLDSSPTHSYMKALYKYPQREYPYAQLVQENAKRHKAQGEFELADTGVFDGGRYFDVFAEYAKGSPNDVLIRVTLHNRGPEDAELHLLGTLWFRNTWSWGCGDEGCWCRPTLGLGAAGRGVEADHSTLGKFQFHADTASDGTAGQWLFTENDTNHRRLYGGENEHPYVKDAFDRYVVHGETGAVNPEKTGTKAAAYYRLRVPAGGSVGVDLRLSSLDEAPAQPFGEAFGQTFDARIAETDTFYDSCTPRGLDAEQTRVVRQADAGLLWSKQFYYYVVRDWLRGDLAQPAPPSERKAGRNADWSHLYNRDIISMPDKWEYPWYAAWDLAFHTISFARLDAGFAKEQLLLMLREWYMHPNGQIPAYEFELSDVNPPVHAWACWRVYKMTGKRGGRDRDFLARAFQKLLLNFTWWVNRKDANGRHLFTGGFLGLDNIGVFDRSKPLPIGGTLEQADGTAWMAFYCGTMLSMALELALEQPEYEDLASKFFEHFIHIADAMNNLGGEGLWDERDGFYYDQLRLAGQSTPLRVRSMVGLIPLFAVEVLKGETIDRLPGFKKRMRWFIKNRSDLARTISCMSYEDGGTDDKYLLAIPTRGRLERIVEYLLDESEFLSPYGIRSLSRTHQDNPYHFLADGAGYTVGYVPGESDSYLFGGNSNWRGPVWFPVNYLMIEALERYDRFYGGTIRVECPTGSGVKVSLGEAAHEIRRRLVGLFMPDDRGRRPCHGDDLRYTDDPGFRGLLLFHEYFHGETGRGLGASHQTGWTALVSQCINDTVRMRGELSADSC